MPAVPTAAAVSKAIARAAGALRRVLIGVPSKDMPMHRMRVKLLTPIQVVNAACDHDPVITAPVASKPGNAAAAGQEIKAQSTKNDA